MPGFTKENCTAAVDDEPPETRNEVPKGLPLSAKALSAPAAQFRQRLERVAALPPHSPRFKEQNLSVRSATLKELLTALSKPNLFKEIVEPNLEAVFGLIASNLFRPVGAAGMRDFPFDGDEPGLQLGASAQWTHLHPVYLVLGQLFMNPLIDRKLLRTCVDDSFLSNYLHLFESEDPLERETLKLTLHRLYIQLVSRRKVIRTKIYSVFEAVVHDLTFHPGLGELAEFLSSVVAGFNTPLSEEHLLTFRRTVLPLVKLPNFRDFQKPLSACLLLYVSKERSLAAEAVRALLRFWPQSNVKKEAAFLAQISDVAEQVGGFDGLATVFPALARRVSQAVASHSPAVCDKALILLISPSFQGCLKESNPALVAAVLSGVRLARQRQLSKTLWKVLERVHQTLEEFVTRSGGERSLPPMFSGSAEFEAHRSRMEGRWEDLTAGLLIREPEFAAPDVPYRPDRVPLNGSATY